MTLANANLLTFCRPRLPHAAAFLWLESLDPSAFAAKTWETFPHADWLTWLAFHAAPLALKRGVLGMDVRAAHAAAWADALASAHVIANPVTHGPAVIGATAAAYVRAATEIHDGAYTANAEAAWGYARKAAYTSCVTQAIADRAADIFRQHVPWSAIKAGIRSAP